ncbi:putative bifunctional diguanylate cyclase/phosphodiesterase [Ferdinandcohnia sp. Marseille-Q9671]
MFGKETNDSDDAKDSIRIGCVFGIAVIAAHYISLWGFQRTITDHWHHYVNLGKGMVPFLIVGVSFLLINVFIGNLYQQRLLKEQRRLKYQERYYQPLYELHPDAIIMLDTKGNILRLNPVAEKIGGMEKENLIGKHFQDFIPTHEQDIIKQRFESVLAGEVIEYEISMYNAIGKTIDIYVKNIPIIVDNKILGIYGIIKDITEVKKNIEKIEFMAYHAPLTNLPNQRRLIEDVATKIESNIAFSLLLLDLNEFKKTNDRYGHLAGDAVLKEVAKRLVKTSNGGVAYHIGGDEFVVTLPCAETYTIQEIAITIAKEICLPIRYNKFTLEVYTSIGIARFPSDGHSINELLQKADLAMYASKEKTDNEIVFYNENLLKKVEERFLLEQDLKDALEKKQFQIYFQPQFDLSTGKFRGAEALIRWNHPEKGILQPANFIHVLEETGLIVDVGEWILIEVLKAMQSWIDAGYDFQRISVNISAQHFEKQNLHTFIEDKIKVHSVCLRNLDIEITESALINLEKSIDSVMQLKDLGISISLDDFGTGYSSLNVLRELPIDCLKIDRSFIRNFDSDSKILIEMILNMAKKLNVKVVAEGIETKEQLDFLIAEGCDFGQGYYFSKPLPREEFVEKWLKR